MSEISIISAFSLAILLASLSFLHALTTYFKQKLLKLLRWTLSAVATSYASIRSLTKLLWATVKSILTLLSALGSLPLTILVGRHEDRLKKYLENYLERQGFSEVKEFRDELRGIFIEIYRDNRNSTGTEDQKSSKDDNTDTTENTDNEEAKSSNDLLNETREIRGKIRWRYSVADILISIFGAIVSIILSYCQATLFLGILITIFTVVLTMLILIQSTIIKYAIYPGQKDVNSGESLREVRFFEYGWNKMLLDNTLVAWKLATIGFLQSEFPSAGDKGEEVLKSVLRGNEEDPGIALEKAVREMTDDAIFWQFVFKIKDRYFQ